MKNKTILIQGAMDIEVEYFINHLEKKEKHTIAGYEFYTGYIHTSKIIISKTLVGVVNATTATTIGIMTFHPDFVINQGIAGAHKSNIHIGDIIIGEKCCNINAFSMPTKEEGHSSNPFEWEPNKRGKEIQNGDEKLVKLFKDFFETNHENAIYTGTLGSGDVFNREYDRIVWLQNQFHHLSEDMESIGTYCVCNQFQIPCVGIRIISNNELTNEKLDKEQAIRLQELFIKLFKTKYIYL